MKLDFLKSVVGEEVYTEEMDKKVAEEIGKRFVSREDFNVVNNEKKALTDTVKERDAQLEKLKTSAGDIEALRTQITELQQTNKSQAETHAKELKNLRIDNAVETALLAAKAKNVKAVKALLDLDEADIDDAGEVKGLADQIKKLTEAEETKFLFDEEKYSGVKVKGLSPAEKGTNDSAAKNPKDMSYDELCAYLDSGAQV